MKIKLWLCIPLKAGLITSLFITAIFLSANAQYTKLLDFAGISNGANPTYASLISDGTYMYGVTYFGGTNNMGIIFKIKPDGSSYAKLYDFNGITNGSSPIGSLISDGTFLYGMTYDGGTNNKGVVFKIKLDGSSYSKLLDFDGTNNGSLPRGSLISDGTFLYGMTEYGGTYNTGVLFKIKPDGSSYSKLIDFDGTNNGGYPAGSLLSVGIFLYGMTAEGGTNNDGVVFKIKPDGSSYSKLLDFDGPNDGAFPLGTLITDGTFLYGMTNYGGSIDYGVIFKIMPDGSAYSTILTFNITNGMFPDGSLVYDGVYLYGMTEYGGINDMGVIFQVKTDGTSYAKLLDFAGSTNGGYPQGSFISDGTFLYGMTSSGGIPDMGVIFKYASATAISETIETDFTVFPNPAHGMIVIQSSENISAIEIENVLGEKIYSSEINSSQTIGIDLSKEQNGIYFIQVKTGRNTDNYHAARKKIMISK